ncbi:histone acetyltransferase KAT6B-like [Astyanax mexicanus]|uniref:histone acetyltransferase KAT6B-like n=1 Tax=Astyanax mexicanus TaxID=7994 RepID=UPI0020CB3354|nr:histone acetyltransferase KAT6B-like [Astyanax mexicanus]
MSLFRAILTAAGAAAATAVITGSYFYLFRSSAQKQETTEEIAVTPVEEDRQTVEERQAEAELTVDSDLCETKSLMEEGEVYSPQEEGQVPAIIEDGPEASGLLQDTVLAKKVEAEVIKEPDLCEEETEEGEVYSPQEEGQAPAIIEDAPEAPGLLQDTVLAEEVEAEVIMEPDLCEEKTEKGEVYSPQEEDQAPAIIEDGPEAPGLLQDTVLAEEVEAEVIMEPDLCEEETEKGEVYSPQEEDQAPAIIEDGPEAPGLLQDTVLAEKVEAEVIKEPDLCEEETEEGIVYSPHEEEQAPQILEDQQTLTSVDLAKDPPSSSSDDGPTKKRFRRRGTRGRGRKIIYKNEVQAPAIIEDGPEAPGLLQGSVVAKKVETEETQSVMEEGEVKSPQEEDQAPQILEEPLTDVDLSKDPPSSLSDDGPTKKRFRRRGTRGRGRKIIYKKDIGEERSQRETTQ